VQPRITMQILATFKLCHETTSGSKMPSKQVEFGTTGFLLKAT